MMQKGFTMGAAKYEGDVGGIQIAFYKFKFDPEVGRKCPIFCGDINFSPAPEGHNRTFRAAGIGEREEILEITRAALKKAKGGWGSWRHYGCQIKKQAQKFLDQLEEEPEEYKGRRGHGKEYKV